jgi:cytochrome c6
MRPATRSALLAALLLAGGSAHGADSLKGQQLYQINCAICHGPTGRSVEPGSPDFQRGEGMMRPDMALLAAIRAGKNAMPAFQGRLTDRDILDVIAYLRTLH